ADWLGGDKPRLWRYERHYHAELVSLAAMASLDPGGSWLGEAQRLIESWERAAPPLSGSAWEPYPVARRVLSWAEACALAPGLRPLLAPRLLPHLRFLRRHLEWHLLGNHIITDGAALVAGACVLEDAEPLAKLGAQVLVAELRRQVLPDGGYAERTPLYHSI